MTIKMGILMDPIESISYKKDSSLAMLFAAQNKGWEISYMEQKDLFIDDGKAYANVRSIKVQTDINQFFSLGDNQIIELAELDLILMRKDPPFDMNFIYTTYLLEIAENSGVLIANKPQSLRDCNEKIFATHFPECCTPTLVSQNQNQLKSFLEKHEVAIIKPLDGMGGESIFKLEHDGGNTNVILDTLTDKGLKPAMIQKFIPEVSAGDKRILLIDGEPIPFGLARIPQGSDIRGNLAAGGKGEVQAITDRERWICDQISPTLKAKGLFFVGIDVIGGHLTEINVTSPTCIREIDNEKNTDIATKLLNCLESKLNKP